MLSLSLQRLMVRQRQVIRYQRFIGIYILFLQLICITNFFFRTCLELYLFFTYSHLFWLSRHFIIITLNFSILILLLISSSIMNKIISQDQNNKIYIIDLNNNKMAQRLKLLSQKISSPVKLNQVKSALDYFGFSQLLTNNQKQIHSKVLKFVDCQLKNKFSEHIQRAQFPIQIIQKLRQLDIVKYFLDKPYGNKLPTHVLGLLLAQLSRADASISTFLWLQASLIGFTVQQFGSQKQKLNILPKINKLQIVGGWSLTQINVGSDASSMQSEINKSQDGKYYLNGNKRWIGNGNGDILIVWARNTQNKQIQGFIVPNKSKGLTSVPIKNKLPLRMVQNCQIQFNNIQINMQTQKLQKGRGFREVNKVLKHSRLLACWIALGLGFGVYEKVIQYGMSRTQFGQPIIGFQLVQQKVVKIMSTIQGCLFLCHRMSQLVDSQKATMGQVAMTKAYVTQRIREVCKWARQILGGNGITHDLYVMKALVDIEGIYTYQGTYDINTLVAGREITGMDAFRAKK